MPRAPRYYLGGYPVHLIQRSNDRHELCFKETDDYVFYLDCLNHACERFGIALHAYVLMPNHTHLLMTPRSRDSVAKTMQSIGRKYVKYFNNKYDRSGSLWSDRHSSSVVDFPFILSCYQFIESNPVRAGLVEHVAHYSWSSYRYNGEGVPNVALTPHQAYEDLAEDKLARLSLYRQQLGDGLKVSTLSKISIAASVSRPLGDQDFIRRLSENYGLS